MGTVTRSFVPVLIALVTACTGPAAPAVETRVVEVGAETWTVLVGGEDGMRGRTDFAGADGMLFEFDPGLDTSRLAWVMDGVAFPLDIVWFDDQGLPVDILTMPVCETQPCPTYIPAGPYRWAIEAPVGAFESLEATDRLIVGGG